MTKNLLWRMFSLSFTYPVAFPALMAYSINKDQKYLDVLYSIRSLTHGIPQGKGLRLSKNEGISLVFPSREDPNFEDVFLRNVYYPYNPTKDDVIFDVGAHMGFFSVSAAKKVKKVIAFEPDPRNYSYLLKNIKRNKLSNIIAINKAAGKQDGTIFLERSYGQGRTHVTDVNTGYKVDVKSVDSIAQTMGIMPTVIKIDTEGFEIPILEGAEAVLAKAKPKLLIASYHYPNEAQEVIKHLTQKNYRCYRYDVPYTLQKARETYIYAQSIDSESQNS